jgi:hypothetical protein
MVVAMAQTQIKEVRPPHDAILDVMLANPWITLAELSRVTGYSISWLSQVKRSDCFVAKYNERRGDIECGVMAGIQERLNDLTHLAIDKMDKLLTTANLDADETIDAFDKVLHRNGYAPNTKTQQAPLVQNNTFLVSAGELQELRGSIINGSASVVAEQPAALEDKSSE